MNQIASLGSVRVPNPLDGRTPGRTWRSEKAVGHSSCTLGPMERRTLHRISHQLRFHAGTLGISLRNSVGSEPIIRDRSGAHDRQQANVRFPGSRGASTWTAWGQTRRTANVGCQGKPDIATFIRRYVPRVTAVHESAPGMPNSIASSAREQRGARQAECLESLVDDPMRAGYAGASMGSTISIGGSGPISVSEKCEEANHNDAQGSRSRVNSGA